MKLFRKKSSEKAVRKEDAVAHLSQKFNIPAEDMVYEFKEKVPGWRNGKPEAKDTLKITVKQPSDKPNLHHDMQQELRAVFSAYYGAGAFHPKAMKFYFGVSEDQEYTAQLNAERHAKEGDKEPIQMLPEVA